MGVFIKKFSKGENVDSEKWAYNHTFYMKLTELTVATLQTVSLNCSVYSTLAQESMV